MSKILKVHHTCLQDGRIIRPEPLTLLSFSLETEHSEEKAPIPDPQMSLKRVQTEAEQMLKNAQEEAEQIRQRAQEERKRVLAEAKEQARFCEEEAKKRGFEAGYQEGMAAAQKECADTLAQARKVIMDAHREKVRILQSSEQLLVNLALAVAEKIMHRACQEGSTFILSVVREAIRQVEDAKRVEIRVHPSELPLLKKHMKEIAQDGGLIQECVVHADPQIQPGGCVVQTEKGNVDARLDTQLQALRQALQEAAEAMQEDGQMDVLQASDRENQNIAS